MYQPLRTSSAASLAVLASLITGCVSQEAERGGTMHYAKVNEDAGLATRAMVALGANKVPEAIDLAERAVAKSPDDAGFRALLGNTYFAGGRFRSAEAAYKDALTIYSNQPRVVLKLALVQIALGKNDEAIGLLKSARPMVDDSNYGLALALAGHSDEAIAVLEPAARRDDADATARQNLALAYAFAGDWIKARTIAAQDVPGNQLDGRIHQWMQLANPKTPSDRVAALVGVTPAVVDQGQPVQLALLKSDSRLAAAPAAPVAPVAKPPIVQTALATPAPAPVQAVAPAPPPARPNLAVLAASAVAPAPLPARPTLAALAASAVSEAKAVLASVVPHSQLSVVPHSQPSVAKPVKPHAIAAAAVRRGNSSAVVQLGAYGSADRVLTAWNGTAAKYRAVKAYLPMSARFVSPKGIFYRLSVRGFSSVGEANALCNSLRRQGGSCFVRNFAGDQPVQYASR